MGYTKSVRFWLVCSFVLVGGFAFGKSTRLADFSFQVPEGWQVVQNAKDNGTIIYSLSRNTNEVITVYVKDASADISGVFGNNGANFYYSSVEGQWSTNLTELTSGGETMWVKGFSQRAGNHVYYGFSRAPERAVAEANAVNFLKAGVFGENSLTGTDYKGKKYYVGFGAAMEWDPQSMHNEVKYDVLHTHNIFTKDIGGSYIGTAFTDYKTATAAAIRGAWKNIKDKMGADDMYVQYSSGHGSHTDLAVGVSYKEIRDMALSMPAKEIIIFIMSCYSGNLVSSFDQKKDVWKNWQAAGRTLMVMASSGPSEESSTGPGTDGEEVGGPDGSAGSAFGHALWKSLIGHADGAVDGVKDGFIALGEIEKYGTAKTIEVGGHTPVTTGAYNKALVMNRVPPKSFIDSLEHNSDKLSVEEVRAQLQKLDQFRLE